MFARRLLASSDLVPRPGGRALWTPLPMAIQNVTSTGLRSKRVRTTRGGPATGVWLSRSPSLITSAIVSSGQGIQPGSTLQSGRGTGAD